MGTETSKPVKQTSFDYDDFVKLNNPLMGTETRQLI